MSLGQITKQIAQEALGNQLKELTDPSPAAPAAPVPENPAAAVMGQIQAMQSALKDDQELVVTWQGGLETIRVMEMFAPNPKLIVMTGFDPNRALTRVVTGVDALQLVCKPGPVKDGAKATRIRLVATPPPKS